MKIGILTASRTDNNGTDLQALAMQTLFQRFGNDVELINYKCTKLENSRKVFYPHNLSGLLSIPYKIYRHHVHERFRKRFFKMSETEYDKNNLSTNEYDVVVVGSDQIWNLSITGNDLSFFLPYENRKQKKYSYAASLGRTDVIPWDEKYEIEKKLRDFDVVSVREDSGVHALAKIGISAQADLDPILMMTQSEWSLFTIPSKKHEKYILVYVVDQTREAVTFANNLAKKMGLIVICVDNPIKPLHGARVKRFVGVEEWIGLVRDADIIVTNSYHCLSFTFLFNRTFVWFELKDNKESNTRLLNLMINMTGSPCEQWIPISLNWEDVNRRLNNLRNRSMKTIERMVANDD